MIFSDKQIWQIKKYNGLLLIALLLIQAHFIVGDYYSDGTLSYATMKSLFQKPHIKLFSTIFYGSLFLHIFTAVKAVVALRQQDRTIRKRVEKVVLLICSLCLLVVTIGIWSI